MRQQINDGGFTIQQRNFNLGKFRFNKTLPLCGVFAIFWAKNTKLHLVAMYQYGIYLSLLTCLDAVTKQTGIILVKSLSVYLDSVPIPIKKRDLKADEYDRAQKQIVKFPAIGYQLCASTIVQRNSSLRVKERVSGYLIDALLI